jgi:hypothetical protein
MQAAISPLIDFMIVFPDTRKSCQINIRANPAEWPTRENRANAETDTNRSSVVVEPPQATSVPRQELCQDAKPKARENRAKTNDADAGS